jgi:hypothetical protein
MQAADAISMGVFRFVALGALGIALLLPANPFPKGGSHVWEYPTPDVREEQTIIVDGVAEQWQLKWLGLPKPVCEPSDVSLTCPCQGFAYGEGGNLALIRLRNGSEIDRLLLTPFFEDAPDAKAVLQRWEPDHDKDFNAAQKDDFAVVVAKRPTVQLMHFSDYDHDGQASEFYLQTEAAPCGKSVGVAVGISRTNPRLHAFTAVSNPSKPLFLQKHEWEALRDTSGEVEVLDWRCGDHGAESQTTLRLSWSKNGIYGTRREFSCTSDGKAADLIHEQPL